MKVEYVGVGSFIQRSRLHLNELYELFKYGYRGNVLLGKEFPQQAKEKIGYEKIRLIDEYIDRATIDCELKNPYRVVYTRDGVVYTLAKPQNSSTPQKVREKIKEMQEEFEQGIYWVLSQMYTISHGEIRAADAPEILSTLKKVTPVVLCSKLSEKEQKQLFQQLGEDLLETEEYNKVRTYLGKNLIVLLDPKYSEKKQTYYEKLVSLAIFIEGVKHVLSHSMNMFRNYWRQIVNIRGHANRDAKKLQLLRDALLSLQSELISHQARISRLKDYLSLRRKEIQHYHDKPAESLMRPEKEKDVFDSLETDLKYLQSVWNTAIEYSKSTVEMMSLIYEADSQRQLGLLQSIFLVGVVASLISIGAMPGAVLSITGPGGETYTGTMSAFSIEKLLIFAPLAILGGIIVWLITRRLYQTSTWLFKQQKL